MERGTWRDSERVLPARSLTVRTSHVATTVLAAFALSVVLLPGCAPPKRTNPDFCEPAAGIDDCAKQEKVCDVARYRCVTLDGGGIQTGGRGGAGGAAGGAAGAAAGGSGGGSGGAGTDGGADTSPTPMCPPCAGATPVCDATTGLCRACSAHLQCAEANPLAPFCDASTGECVVCASADNCKASSPTRPFCLERRQCVACLSSTDCPEATPVCDAANSCSVCRSDMECASRNPALPICTTAGTCVECTSSAHCPLASKPACGATNSCGPCKSDRECEQRPSTINPGVCMFHADGRCATDSEVLYVKPTAGLCDDMAFDAGTIAKPFCTPQRAIGALMPAKPVIVIRPGGTPIERWSYSAVAGVPELTVIGQDGATIGPASGTGITINSGNVYLRGLRVSGMFDAGVYVATGNATLRMNRCIITQNRGGLFINGAGFDIANSVFASNGLASIPNANGPAIEFSGVYLGGIPTGRRVFRNNTVYQNAGPGLVCGGAYPVTGVLVTGNARADVVMCNFDPVSSEVPGQAVFPPYDPLFDTRDPKNPYRLTSMSTCVDRGVPGNDAPTDDIDGNPRPIGRTSDCGAHEFGAAPPAP